MGYGGAGAAAAITVGEGNASAIVLEKAPEPGGSSGGSAIALAAGMCLAALDEIGFMMTRAEFEARCGKILQEVSASR